MSLNDGERQVAPTADGIRRDHVARYEFALDHIPPGSRVLDLACGVGYGSDILAKAGHTVVGIDRDAEAIDYARQHYAGNGAEYRCADVVGLELEAFDAAVCFETIEHIADPLPVLKKIRKAVPLLIASVPNESRFPFRNYKFHHRHYTRAEFFDLLNEAGFKVKSWYGQEGPESPVEHEIEGRTLLAITEPFGHVPEHVVIVGLGPSMAAFSELTKRLGGNSAFCDEVWGLNAVGNVLVCDRIFQMDDVKIQESRAELNPGGNIAGMLKWMRHHPGPIYTSVVRPGYPGLVPFPLEAVLNGSYDSCGEAPYFNSTAAYAIAYAVHIGVKKITLFGVDYTLPNIHQGEQGRACCEFWLGIAAARGIEINVPEQTTLLDACAPERERLYGYDCVDVIIRPKVDGSGLKVELKDREDIPTAQEIEKRYDHKKHPNRLMKEEAQ